MKNENNKQFLAIPKLFFNIKINLSINIQI